MASASVHFSALFPKDEGSEQKEREGSGLVVSPAAVATCFFAIAVLATRLLVFASECFPLFWQAIVPASTKKVRIVFSAKRT